MQGARTKGLKALEFDARVILVGQILITTGTAFLSLGQIFKLLKVDELPTQPINMSSAPHAEVGGSQRHTTRRSYFES